MEEWIKNAKDVAKWEADWIIKNIEITAEQQQVDKDWFIEEVLKNIRSKKGVKE